MRFVHLLESAVLLRFTFLSFLHPVTALPQGCTVVWTGNLTFLLRETKQWLYQHRTSQPLHFIVLSTMRITQFSLWFFYLRMKFLF